MKMVRLALDSLRSSHYAARCARCICSSPLLTFCLLIHPAHSLDHEGHSGPNTSNDVGCPPLPTLDPVRRELVRLLGDVKDSPPPAVLGHWCALGDEVLLDTQNPGPSGTAQELVRAEDRDVNRPDIDVDVGTGSGVVNDRKETVLRWNVVRYVGGRHVAFAVASLQPSAPAVFQSHLLAQIKEAREGKDAAADIGRRRECGDHPGGGGGGSEFRHDLVEPVKVNRAGLQDGTLQNLAAAGAVRYEVGMMFPRSDDHGIGCGEREDRYVTINSTCDT